MKEQSHKEEMSKALRGDFARLRERGVAATLAPRDGFRSHAKPEAQRPIEEPQATEAVEPPHAEPAEATEGAPPRPGWLGRLLGQ